METVYFDNNATTAVAPEVFEAMTPFLTRLYGSTAILLVSIPSADR